MFHMEPVFDILCGLTQYRRAHSAQVSTQMPGYPQVPGILLSGIPYAP
jgi:hypothetical protein